jgi:uncharacterized protein with HEPN domain
MDERDRDRLMAMRDDARLAMQHVASGGPNWRHDQKTVDAAAKRIEDIGEQAKRVTPEQQASMPSVPWRALKGMRDRLTHDYLGMDIDVLADVIANDLQPLIDEIDAALKNG